MDSSIKSFSYSVIIPTYNRKTLLVQSIRSALYFFQEYSNLIEIVVVDDASTDKSEGSVKKKFRNELRKGVIKYYRLLENVGVTSAKNYGALKASNEFYIFLDSDDELTGNIKDLIDANEMIRQCGIGFFRCISKENKKIVGKEFGKSQILKTKDYLKIFPFPECLPVIHKKVFETDSYRGDLRGFEGHLYMKRLFEGHKIFLSNKILRKYSEEGFDSISSQRMTRPRLRQLAKGSKASAYLAWKNKQYRFVLKYLPRYIYYLVRGYL